MRDGFKVFVSRLKDGAAAVDVLADGLRFVVVCALLKRPAISAKRGSSGG